MPHTVYVVEDDTDMRDSLKMMLGSRYPVECFASAEEFIAALDHLDSSPRCLLLDVGLPRMDGLAMQRELKERGISIPIIMLSGHADVPMAVEALQGGAVTFLEKPVPPAELLQTVKEAFQQDRVQAARQRLIDDCQNRLDSLSRREREVLELTAQGRNSKQMSAELGIGVATVLKHKAQMLEKMGIRSDAELCTLITTVRGPEFPADSAEE
jgi:two-component system, LuxR family, response regulator FixJ